jgi:hypothetical protein
MINSSFVSLYAQITHSELSYPESDSINKLLKVFIFSIGMFCFWIV